MRAQLFTLATLWTLGCGGTDPELETPSDDPTDEHSDHDTDAPDTDEADTETTAGSYQGEVWADNWSAMWVDGAMVMEDSVSITTERSFNSETFTFEAEPPFLVAAMLKDFIETDSGLEYIGSSRQQMGDGGYIAQLTDELGDVVLVTSGDWRCITIHEAPLNKDCEDDPDPDATCLSNISAEPEGWAEPDFDDSGWLAASIHPAADVDPKHGYDDITWDASAEFIWGADLESHNTVLCRAWVTD